MGLPLYRSNNTNKLSPQEPFPLVPLCETGSNNTNKLSPQELGMMADLSKGVQIIQINLVLKNEQAYLLMQMKFK